MYSEVLLKQIRNRFTPISLGFLLAGFSLSALSSAPIATVTSAEPFTLDGQSVTTPGITSWPLEVGNEVATSTAPAVLFFHDGSSVKLAADSRAKLTGSERQPKLVLMAGSLDYKVVLGSNLSVTNLDVERKAKPRVRPIAPPTKPLSTPRGDEITLTGAPR
jgi:hypothetical protein